MMPSTTERRPGRVLFQQHSRLETLSSYRVELAQELLDEEGQLIDWLIGLAFDTLATHMLDLRVVPSEQTYPAAHY
jgi:hypothetical protein